MGSRDPAAGELEPPKVPPGAYTESYYRERCLGSAEWAESDGLDTHAAFPYYLELTELVAGEVLVDIGAGRGEIIALAAERGAARAVGIEYSPDAVKLARQTLAAHGNSPQAEILLADARSLPLEADTADVVTLFDVVEHLTPTELSTALDQVRRILKPGGRVVIHTMPNRLYYDVTWRVLSLFHPSWPRDPRNDLEREMHVNEQTRRGLRRSLEQAGLRDVDVRYGKWVHDVIVPSRRTRRLVRWLAGHRPTAWLGAADLWATARG